MNTKLLSVILLSLLIASCASVERLANNKTIHYKNGAVYFSQVGNQCSLALTGEINSELLTAFKTATNAIENKDCAEKVSILGSYGGSVDVAIEIGQYLRKKGYSTELFPIGECYSSCTLIFISGNRRLILGHTPFNLFAKEIGVHQASKGKNISNKTCITQSTPNQEFINKMNNYVQQMLPTDGANYFLKNMMETDCNNLKFLNPKEMIQLNIATEYGALLKRF